MRVRKIRINGKWIEVNNEDSIEEIFKNEEDEEKPLSEAQVLQSEDVHGGEESTESIENSPSPSENEDGEDKNMNLPEGKSENTEEKKDNEDNDKKSTDKKCTDSDNKIEENTDKKNTNSKTTEEKEEKNNESGNTDRDTGKCKKDNEEGNDNGEDNENSSENDEETNNRSESENEECIADGNRNNEDNEEEYNDNEEGEYNSESVVEHKYVSIPTLRYVWYRLVDVLADERAGEEEGTEILSIKKLVRRVIDKRPLHRCYSKIIRESIYLLLDDSGSMWWWANILNAISTVSQKRKDIVLLWCPNGDISNGWGGDDRINDPKDIPKTWKNTTIIYVGDFDGGNAPYYLAKAGATVIWFCPEGRYDDTREHDWCSFSLREYPKNVYFYRALTLHDLFMSIRKAMKEVSLI